MLNLIQHLASDPDSGSVPERPVEFSRTPASNSADGGAGEHWSLYLIPLPTRAADYTVLFHIPR